MARCLVHVHEGFGPRIATLWNATNIDRSFVRNDAGSGQFALPITDAYATNQYMNRAGLRYAVESLDGLPWWVGYKPPGQTWRKDGETWSLPLREVTYLLSGQVTGASDSYSQAAGGIFRQALRQAQLANPLPFQIGDMSDQGPYLSKEFRYTSLYEVARQLTDAANGYQWWAEYAVTPSSIAATLRWGSRRGVDRSSVVALEEGRNIAAWPTWEDEGDTERAKVIYVGTTSGGTAYANRPTATAQQTSTASGVSNSSKSSSTQSGGSSGRTQVIHDEQASDERAAKIAADLALAAAPRRSFSVTVTDSSLWGELDIDNQVRLRLPTYGFDGTVRITGVQPDEAEGEVALTLE